MKEKIIRNTYKEDPMKVNLKLNTIVEDMSTRQRELTEEWILPYIDLIIEDVRKLRVIADKKLKKTQHIKNKNRERLRIDRYPIGRCREVRNEVYELMVDNLLNQNYQGLKMVRQFIKAGGVFDKFWAIGFDKYFHNAIQIGTSILDVANDTVERVKEKVVFYDDIDTAPIKQIKDFEQYADIVEKYWKVKVYPNVYFPRLAHMFPMLIVDNVKKRGVYQKDIYGLSLDNSNVWQLGIRNICTQNKEDYRCGLAEKFIFNSKYSERRLPQEALDALLNKNSMASRIRQLDLSEMSTDIDRIRDGLERLCVDDDGKELLKEYMKMGIFGKNVNKFPLAVFHLKK